MNAFVKMLLTLGMVGLLGGCSTAPPTLQVTVRNTWDRPLKMVFEPDFEVDNTPRSESARSVDVAPGQTVPMELYSGRYTIRALDGEGQLQQMNEKEITWDGATIVIDEYKISVQMTTPAARAAQEQK